MSVTNYARPFTRAERMRSAMLSSSVVILMSWTVLTFIRLRHRELNGFRKYDEETVLCNNYSETRNLIGQ